MSQQAGISKSYFTIELEVVGPLMTRSAEARHFSEDLLGLVTGEGKDRRPALPGTLVKGTVRAAMREMLDSLHEQESEKAGEVAQQLESVMTLCFGPEAPSEPTSGASPTTSEQEGGSWEPDRGALNFSGYWCARPQDLCTAMLSRIEINDETGTVEPGALVVARSPLQPGQRATFRGSIETWLPPAQLREILPWLKRACSLIGAVGGATTVGFGEVANARIREPETRTVSPEARDDQPLSFGLRLEPDRPFCFAKPHGRGNVLESHPFIPGGAIIGAVAEALQRSGTKGFDLLKRNLHAIHVSHGLAVPSDDEKLAKSFRPSPIPLSVAWTPSGVMDTANARPHSDAALIFSSDWKNEQRQAVRSAVRDSVNVQLTSINIVRNRIDPETRAAAESALFAVEAIEPTGYEWRCNVTIDTDAVKDGDRPGVVLAQFRQLLEAGITGLGKTKARARVEIVKEPFSQAFTPQGGHSQELQTGETVRMLLVTDADLLGPVANLRSTGGAEQLRQLYQEYFDLAFKKSLVLVDWYTTEQLAGGQYVYRRFWAGNQKHYLPHVMTGAGSLFVLKVSQDLDHDGLPGLQQRLERAKDFGLPNGPLLNERLQASMPESEPDWKRHPWLPAQGYGEIVLQPELGLNDAQETEHVER
ncbi:MAG: hypothetical protein GVY11_02350 [Gammaproteobacteria bacterium]|jgi:hypothetical protein|nr:hypothetical protein [Gammaproteobacteria bacterium]